MARPPFHGTDLPGADADRHRSGPSLPVHPQFRAQPGAAIGTVGHRRADARPGAAAGPGAALHPHPGTRPALHLPRVPGRALSRRAVPRIHHPRPGDLPGHSRQRGRDRGRGRGPGAGHFFGTGTPAARVGDPPDFFRPDPQRIAVFRHYPVAGRRVRRVRRAWPAGPAGYFRDHQRRAARPVVRAVQSALPGTHFQLRRRRLCGDPRKGHHRPSPL